MMATEQSTEEVKRYRYHDIHKTFTPRSYQIEILEAAKKGNVIACMGTGTGKTFIAVLLIQENADEVRLPFSKGGKRIFFLVPTVPLVLQQKKAIQNHTDLKVKGYHSEVRVNSWEKELKSTEVLVMTAEIFRMIIDHAFIPLNKIKLLIIDECHLAQKEHPYKQIMERFMNIKSSEMPKIFGLSASLLKGKVKPVQLETSMQELEKVLRSIIITARDINDFKVYGTDPKEISVYYQVLEFTSSDLRTEILNFSSQLKLEKSEFDRNDEFFSKNEIFFDKPLRCLKSLLAILENLGLWGAHTAAKIYLKDVIFMRDHPFSDKCQNILKKVQKFLIKLIKKCQILLRENGSHVTHKLKTLQAIFLSIKQRNLNETSSISDTTFECDIEKYFPNIEQLREYLSVSDINMCSIVFVEQKITAYVLYKWLIDMKKKIPSLAFLKPEFIVGHGRTDLSETTMSLRKQKKILSRFRQKKCNLLIATSILEEGVDIQQCNLVIRFDLPLDFRSYIQSKGRARAKNSMYILMVPKHPATVSEFLQNMSDFKTIEKMLLERCHNRIMPSEEEISDHMADGLISAYMPYGPQGPRVTMSSSISLINRYCANLPSDIATKSEPHWDIKVVDPDSNEIQYVCMLHLQINSSLKQTIIGENMKQKRLAKMSAALKACKLLHEIGELDEHLMPVSCSVDKALVEELGLIKKNIDEILPEKNRRRQPHDKHVPIFLKNARPASGIPCYLHVFEMDLIEPLPKCLNPQNRPLFNPMTISKSVALLISKILPPVNPFPIFTKSGKILVKVNALKNTVILSAEDLKKVEEFHKFVFSDTLWLNKNKNFSPACSEFSAYIVPVNKVETANYDIDWSFIDATKAHPYNDQKYKTLAVKRTHFDEELFKDSVLIPIYKISEWENACPSFHHVINIVYNMSPESKLDESTVITFKDYYKAKYNIQILNDKQPLVETVQSGVGNFWKPLYVSLKDTYEDVPKVRSKQNHKCHNEYLVPELCIIHPFPSSFFNKVIYLPTMLFRLQCLLQAEEIRQNVASEASVGSLHLKHIWPDFNLEKSDKVLKEKLFKKGHIKVYADRNDFVPSDVIKMHEKIMSFEAKVELLDHPGPSPSLILQALTSKSAADEFDSECLKMIEIWILS
ncbi:endoribonuclease Dicer-like isoform X2 [Stegodyphus dumicola]|uniref:endoribonuclease Dicer-like isoform X2 n=1 Tax=Stegodyphus dumicola TaxID=202533 RepID=UPI0015AAD3AB|nr:endoribonuclease Dicer-like isoform X2 [Stegodyphus dumicola]